MPEPAYGDRVANLSDRRRLLLEKLRDRKGPVARPAGTDRVPLSPAQEQLWFLNELDPGQTTYNLVQASYLSGELDVAALRRALDAVVARHEALRTVFGTEGGRPCQVIRPPSAAALLVEEIPGDRESALHRLQETEVHRPFDLASGPLFRARVVTFGPGEHAFALSAHHSVVDGWSMGLIIREVAALYGGSPLGDPPVQYPDYARWQRERNADTALGYWEQRLAGLPVLDLPTDRPRPVTVSFRGATLEIPLTAEAYAGTQVAAKTLEVSPFMVVVAAFGAVLSRWTGAGDLPIGTAFTGRDRPELEQTVGFFANMGVLRLDASGDPAMSTLIGRARDTVLDAWSHQQVPFEKVVQRVATTRDPSRNPLFQVAVQMLDQTTWGGPWLPGLDAAQLPLRLDRSRFDVMVSVVDAGGSYDVIVEYSTDLFDDDRIRRVLRHLDRVLAAGTEQRISELPLLDPADRAELLTLGTGPRRVLAGTGVVELIARQPREAVAIRHEGAEIPYGEMLLRSRRLAAGLIDAGVVRGDHVATRLERGPDEVIARLAIWLAGAVHVPLDVTAPPNRIQRILDKVAPRVVLDPTSVRDLHGADLTASEPYDIACVLHTSGSTGEPKGVPLDHRSLLVYLDWMQGVWQCGPGDRVLHVAAPVFDLALGEILVALTSGATLVIADQNRVLSPGALGELLAREGVTHTFITPTKLGLVETDPATLPALRHVLVAGEICPASLAARWSTGDRRFLNAYGPTEATVAATVQDCTGWNSPVAPPIGRPMPNRRVYLVDDHDNLVPLGARGEILLGGDGVAPGYLGDPDRTAERFPDDPFSPGGRVYRTGDFGSWDAQGRLRFHGRADGQVKLRGLRIELDEIEAALRRLAGPCAVAVRGDHLVGYVVGALPETAALRSALAAELPPHMVPGRFVAVPSLPMTATGKVDRRALPDPPVTADVSGEPPRTAAERLVAAAFGEVLGVADVGRDGSFFELGGHSLLAAYALNRIAAQTGVSVALKQFYADPTVRGVALLLDAGRSAAQRTPLVDLKPGGRRPPLFAPHAVSGSPYWYLGLSRALPADQPVIGFEAPGLEGDEEPIEDLVTLAARYVAALLERHPSGPYALAGWSMGGFLSFEMARQLTEAGRPPSAVVMIDPNSPGPLPLPSEDQVLRTFVADLAGLSGVTPPPLPAGADLTRFLVDAGLLPADVGPDFIAHRYAVFRANMRAVYGYQARPYDGPVVLVQAADEVSRAGWTRYAPDTRIVTLPGDHYSIWSPSRLPALAALLCDPHN